ncbi:MAG: hypothetical protein PHF67_00680 [Candidatus Nanoarchaeia archaeon]|nr:hypothetical protein [Candidatus Nanoarchaeia archaeon]
MSQQVITGPNGKPMQGYPHSKSLAELYSQCQAGFLGNQGIRTARVNLEKIAHDAEGMKSADTVRNYHYVEALLPQELAVDYDEVKAPQPARVAVASVPNELAKAVAAKYGSGPAHYQTGTIVKLIKVDAPREAGRDYSVDLKQGRRLFLRGQKTKPDTSKFQYAKIDSELSRAGLYNGSLLSLEDAAKELGVSAKPSASPAKPTAPAQPPQRKPKLIKTTVEPKLVVEVVDATITLENFVRTLEESTAAFGSLLTPAYLASEAVVQTYQTANTSYTQQSKDAEKALTNSSVKRLPERNPARLRFEQVSPRVAKSRAEFLPKLKELEKAAGAFKETQIEKGYEPVLPKLTQTTDSGISGPSIDLTSQVSLDDASSRTPVGRKGLESTLADSSAAAVATPGVVGQTATSKPGEDIPEVKHYGVRIKLGQAALGIVFPEDALPQTVGDFYEYLADESHFTQPRDRDNAKEFLKRQRGDHTVFFNGQRYDLTVPFRTVFTEYKSELTITEPDKPKDRDKPSPPPERKKHTAYTTTATATAGRPTG